MEKLNFCLVNNWYPPHNFAGSGMYLYHLANALAERGHDVTVLYCKNSFQLRSKGRIQLDTLKNPKVKVKVLESRWGSLAPIIVHQTGRPILNHYVLKKFFQEDFDVIHFNNISLIGGPKIYQYGKGIKLATFHDYWVLCPLSTLFKYGKEICTKKNCFLCTIRAKKPPQLWRYTSLLKSSLIHIDAFISPSKFLKDLYLKEGFDGKIFHIPNFVVPSKQKISETKESLFPEPYYLFAGRLEKTKGVQNLISVFKEGKDSHLLITGDGSYRGKLETLADNSKYIHFLGFVNQRDFITYYRHALALLVPSIWYENCPYVILDAMMTGVPIIAHDVAGPGELVRNSGAGLLYRNREELKEALKRVREREDLREELGERGKKYFNQNLTVEAHLERYFSLIDLLRNEKTK